jgi:hypothetical protein|tara:strand:- start:76 stop:594 length:519 start_codon:yes stop_codon:yes gene_type:complete
MKVEQLIKSTMERPCIFVTGKMDVPVDYFIQEIEKGIVADNAENYVTNLISPMTNYHYFNEDKEFYKLLLPLYDTIEKHDLNQKQKYQLNSSWGFRQGFGNHSVRHQHLPSILSGAICLSSHEQTLFFPQINQELIFEPGNFALFSGYLEHYNKRNVCDEVRYGLSFNLMVV